MDLVDEEHVVFFEIGEQRGQIARALEHRTRGLAQIDAHFGSHDMGQRGLAQTRRTEKQQVIERFAAVACGGHEDIELLADAGLADIVGECLGPERPLDGFFSGRCRRRGNQPVEPVVFDHRVILSDPAYRPRIGS